MTWSESQFRKWAKREYPGSFIVKLPDFKMTGALSGAGLPDYVVFFHKGTIWWEVKTVQKRLVLSSFTAAQLRVFKQMLDCGVDINIFVFDRERASSVHSFSSFINGLK